MIMCLNVIETARWGELHFRVERCINIGACAQSHADAVPQHILKASRFRYTQVLANDLSTRGNV